MNAGPFLRAILLFAVPLIVATRVQAQTTGAHIDGPTQAIPDQHQIMSGIGVRF